MKLCRFCELCWPERKNHFLRWLIMDYILCLLVHLRITFFFFCMLYFPPFPDAWKVCAFTVSITGKRPSSSPANSLNCFKTHLWNLAKLSSYKDAKSCTPMSLSRSRFLQLTQPEQDDVRLCHNLSLLDSFYLSRSLSSQTNY